jgi:hypothetical protein
MSDNVDLFKVISFDGFDFDAKTYRRQEITILQPRLELLGYTECRWSMGESDSFGPLSRICEAKNPEGKIVRLVYG